MAAVPWSKDLCNGYWLWSIGDTARVRIGRVVIAVSAWYLGSLEDARWPCTSVFSPLGFLSGLPCPLLMIRSSCPVSLPRLPRCFNAPLTCMVIPSLDIWSISMGTAVPPAAPPHPIRNTASWSGTAYSSRQAQLIWQLTLISGGCSPVWHLGTCRVEDGCPTAEMEAVWSQYCWYRISSSVGSMLLDYLCAWCCRHQFGRYTDGCALIKCQAA